MKIGNMTTRAGTKDMRNQMKTKQNIILIGFMGSGKTSVGERLARKMFYQFQDMDQLIEGSEGDTISHIFENRGEEYFRNAETNLIQKLVGTLEHTVLSTGGGAPLREENSKLLKELGFVVYLQASKDTTLRRLRGDGSRPLLQGSTMADKVDQLIRQRTPLYTRTAHKIIVTDGRSFEEIIDLIMEEYIQFTR